MRTALANWNVQALHDDVGGQRILLGVILAHLMLMMSVSILENHLAIIWNFHSIKADDELNTARNLFRLQFAGSPSYPYRLVLGAVDPMFIILGLLAGGLSRSWPLLSAVSLLLVVTIIGKSETLSKAPPAFFYFSLWWR